MGDDEVQGKISRTSKPRVSIVNVKSQSSRRKSLANFDSKSTSRARMRRPSYGFAGVPGIRPVERTSQVAIEFKRPLLIFLPTYQLDPSVRFSIPRVTEVINEVLDEYFTGHKYNVQESPTLALRVSGEVMRNCKGLHFNRYRIIAVVTVGQRRAQSFYNAISFLWDHARDNYVDIHREVTTAYIQVTVFGVYLD